MPRAFNSLSSRNKLAKRHYEAIAQAMQEAMRYARGLDDDLAPGAIQAAIGELADVFARDNGMFKRERFIQACEPGANVRARSNGGGR